MSEENSWCAWQQLSSLSALAPTVFHSITPHPPRLPSRGPPTHVPKFRDRTPSPPHTTGHPSTAPQPRPQVRRGSSAVPPWNSRRSRSLPPATATQVCQPLTSEHKHQCHFTMHMLHAHASHPFAAVMCGMGAISPAIGSLWDREQNYNRGRVLQRRRPSHAPDGVAGAWM